MREARIDSWGRLVFLTVALIAAATGCSWNPNMVHPNTFTSGKTLPARRVEVAGQFFPGASVAVGLGRGFESRFSYCYVGEDVEGAELQLVKTVRQHDQFYLSALAGAERFYTDEHDFDGWRWNLGATVSRYNEAGWFGLHIPVRVYYMEYDWTHGFDEFHPSLEGKDWSGTGWVFAPGIGISFEQPYWAVKLAFNGPIPDSVNHIDMWPYFGVQAAVRF